MQTIRLTYVRENYPYIAGCSVRSGVLTACQEPGITSEIWLQFARQYNYTLELVKTANYGAFAEVNGTRLWTGVIGLLVNGSADASLSLLSPNEYRYSDVIFGPVLTTYELGFIYGLPLESQNIVVSVYDQLSIQVLLLIICFCAAVYSVNRGVLEGFWAVVAALSFQNDWWVRLFNPLLIFGFLFINWMYFAGYRSQAIASSWSDRPFANVEEEARSKLASGKLKLIVEDSTLLYNAKMVYGNDGVFERNPPIVERNLEAIGQLLCTDATIVYYGNVAPMGSVWFAKTPCPIKRLEYDDPLTQLTFLSFTISKHFPKKELRRLVQFIDVVFNFEVFNKRWANIYHSRYGQATQTLDVAAIHFESLRTAFRLFYIGLGIAIVCFLCEMYLAIFVYGRTLRRVRKLVSIVRIYRWVVPKVHAKTESPVILRSF